ncbi:MAG: alpha/beta fold hydrolase [Desulfobacterales bacterium]|nr:alpha/beta fold hydrolase [Desulfobacterales bacterium]
MIQSEISSTCTEISFSSDGFLLKGTLHLPQVYRPPVVIGCHGLFSSSSSPKQIALANQCNAYGIAFFRFDHRGCGKSEGKFANVTSLNARCNDLKSAVKAIQALNKTRKLIGLFGSSMGGAVCLSAANSFNVAAIVTFAAPIRSRSIITAIENSDDTVDPANSFDKENLKFDIADRLTNIHSILLFHGDADIVVPPSHAQQIYAKVGMPKRLIMLKDGDHQMSNPVDQKKFIQEAVLWFKNRFDNDPK